MAKNQNKSQAFKAQAQTSPTLSDSQQKTQASFLSLQVITAACHAILNTTFTPPSVKPSWFDSLNSKLDAAKANASDWIDNIAPQLTAGIPNQVIDYASTFQASVQAIEELCAQNPTASGASNPIVMEAAEILTNLANQVKGNISAVDGMATTLKNWGDAMQKSHDDLSNGAVDIQNAIVDLQTDVTAMNNAIANNLAAIQELNKQLVYAQIAVGVGIFMLVAGVALCVATAGTAAVVAGGVAAVGAAAIIGGAVTWGVLQKRINDDYADIANEQKEKSEDQRQIIALQGIAMATNQTISSIETATSTLSDFRTSWALYQDELTGVLSKLNSGASMSSIIMEKVFADAAQNEWTLAVQYAQELVNSKPSVDSKSLQITTQATKVAA